MVGDPWEDELPAAWRTLDQLDDAVATFLGDYARLLTEGSDAEG